MPNNIYIPSGTKVVVFDLGYVLLFYAHIDVTKKIVRYMSITLKEAIKLLFLGEYHQEFFKGLIEKETFYAKVKEKSGLTLAQEDFYRLYDSVFEYKIQEIWRVWADAKKMGLKVVILSNIDQMAYEAALQKFTELKEADLAITSFREGIMKPDKKLLMKIEKYFAVNPCEIFYIDDLPHNIEIAKNRGWQTWLFDKYRGYWLEITKSI